MAFSSHRVTSPAAELSETKELMWCQGGGDKTELLDLPYISVALVYGTPKPQLHGPDCDISQLPTHCSCRLSSFPCYSRAEQLGNDSRRGERANQMTQVL